MPTPQSVPQALRELADDIESGRVQADCAFLVAIQAHEDGAEVRVKNRVVWAGPPLDARVFVAAVQNAVRAVIDHNIAAGAFVPEGDMPKNRSVN